MINEEVIGVTEAHPFYVAGEWIEAQDLKLGDEIFNYSGNKGKVEKISIETKNIKVYNFEVEGNHNYYVGQLSILAHNSCYGNSGKSNKTADEIISSEKKGAINREFPNEWRNSTLKEIEQAAKGGNKTAQKAKKLLLDKRFDKLDNRK